MHVVGMQVSAVAYLRNLTSAPRDMSNGAAQQLRASCDAFLQQAYDFPEPDMIEKIRSRFTRRQSC